ncbi:MAG TPA: hypothetical protein VM345_07310 [Acidimicrobiales bacterium]|jgi:hypothetical protein|nr:hypothetical protein [Acidimicrobiales bacterium]
MTTAAPTPIRGHRPDRTSKNDLHDIAGTARVYLLDPYETTYTREQLLTLRGYPKKVCKGHKRAPRKH